MKISVILPAYNEAKRLPEAVDSVKKYLEDTGYNYEVVIAEDGSTDGTDKIATELSQEDSRVQHLHSKERLGRGKALRKSFESAEGEIVAYMDVDLSTHMKHLKELIDSIAVEGHDIATGSRLMKGSRTERPAKRDVASKGYNFLIRLLLGSKLHDHQCGFKAFKKDVIMELAGDVDDNHWFWDTEVLVLAQRRGYRVKEFPVEWEHGGETKVSLGKDVAYMGSQILRLWGEGAKSSRKFFVFSILLAAGILAALIWYIGASQVLNNLYRADLRFIGLASLIYAFSFLIRGERYRYIMSRLGERVPLLFSSESVAISQTMNVVTPVRIGDVARAYVFKIRDVPFTTSFSGIAVERIFDLIAILLIAFTAIVTMGNQQFFSTSSSSIPFYALLLLILIFAVVILFSRMENVLGKILKDAGDIIKTKGSVVILLTSTAIWIVDIIVCYLIMLSFGVDVFPVVVLAVTIANIAKIIPITPGGIGTYEVVMTGIFVTLGVDQGLSLTVSILDHALKNILTLVLGFAALAVLNIRVKDLRR
ncbi:MAG: flippase-like domain-containing protein [Archaeoglobaceae archaeon]